MAIAQVFLRVYVLQNGGVSMLLYASAGEAFRGEKGQLVYTKTDLRRKKKKKEAQLGCSQKMLDNTEIFRSWYTHP